MPLTPVRAGLDNPGVLRTRFSRLRRLGVLITACLLGLLAASGSEASLGRRLAAALAGSGVDPARSSALAVDMLTGQTIFALNPALSLAPASNEKLAITFAALRALGPAYRIETAVLGRGRLDGVTWRGDLILRGRGDPTLSRASLADLAAQLRQAEIRRVTGAIVGDESYFDARRTAFGWKPEFYVNESPPLSALAIDRSKAPDPAFEAAVTFRKELRLAGITVSRTVRLGRAPAHSFPLASVLSPPLRDIVRAVGTDSDNYTAELLLKQLGAVIARQGTSPAGAAVAMGVLAQEEIPVDGVRIVDGSGLSRLDRLTARSIVSILRAAFADPLIRPSFVASLAVAGRTGTLENRLRTPVTRGNVLAKTGTTSLACSLSGFVRLRFAFAILQNGNPVPTVSARSAQDRFAAVLAAQ